MNIKLPVLLLAAAALGGTVAAHAENTMYACTAADGTVSYTNVPSGTSCEKMFSYAAAAPEAPAPVVAAPAPAAPAIAVAPAAAAEPAATTGREPTAKKARTRTGADGRPAPRTPREQSSAQRSDDARAQVADAMARGTKVANPATSRRYLMTNRADYMQANGIQP
jgi:hypothetical protein